MSVRRSRDRHRDRVAGVNARFRPSPGPLRVEGSTVVGGLEHPIAVEVPGAAAHIEALRIRSLDLAREAG